MLSLRYKNALLHERWEDHTSVTSIRQFVCTFPVFVLFQRCLLLRYSGKRFRMDTSNVFFTTGWGTVYESKFFSNFIFNQNFNCNNQFCFLIFSFYKEQIKLIQLLILINNNFCHFEFIFNNDSATVLN